MVMADHVAKVLCWYDAGYGYAHRAVDLILRFAALDSKAEAVA